MPVYKKKSTKSYKSKSGTAKYKKRQLVQNIKKVKQVIPNLKKLTHTH